MSSQFKISSGSRKRYRRRICQLSLGSFLLASPLTWALPGQTTDALVIPDAPAEPAPAPAVSAPAPRLAAPPAERKTVVTEAAPPARPSQPQKLAAPRVTRPDPVSIQPSQIRQTLQKNSYIDTTPVAADPAPPQVVIKSRQNGCQTVVSGGSLQRGCGQPATAQRSPSVNRSQAPVTAIAPRRQRLAPTGQVTAQRSPLRPLKTALRPAPLSAAIGQPIGSNQVFSLQPIVNRGIEIALAPLPEYTRSTQLYAASQGSQGGQGGTDLIFPVAGVNPITSAFGWRIHPVTGQGRMHQGTDIGASLGTPVLAAYAGTVAAAQWSGGYGLMVTLRHVDGTQESRYAHLSEMFVEPGQTVAQGEMIGRVGSTGLSTGPHLHFEWRHLTNDGWVAVDAGPHLQYALANLMRARELAQASTPPQS